MAKPSAKERKAYLIQTAWERQKLGLSLSEYNALTPFELSCELEAMKLIDERENLIAELLDSHLARLTLMKNGYNFPDLKTVSDCKLLTRENKKKKNNARAVRKNAKKNFEMWNKQAELVKKIKAERDAIREMRKLKGKSEG